MLDQGSNLQIPPPVEPHAASTFAVWHDPTTYDPRTQGPPYLPEMGSRVASMQDRQVIGNVVRPLIQKMAADEMTEITAVFDQVRADFGPTPMSELATLLAFIRAEALVHQSHHWQTRGDTFYGDHLLFERLYGEVNGMIDGVAERMVGSGHHILAHPILLAKHCSMIVQTFYRDAGPNPSANTYPTLSLRAVLRTMVALKLTYQILDESKQLSHGTDNLLQDLSDRHENLVYLLKQRTNNKTAGTEVLVSTPRVVQRFLASISSTDESDVSADLAKALADVGMNPETRKFLRKFQQDIQKGKATQKDKADVLADLYFEVHTNARGDDAASKKTKKKLQELVKFLSSDAVKKHLK